MPVQTQHRFSVKDYYRMAETVLHPDARVELLDAGLFPLKTHCALMTIRNLSRT